MAAKRLQSDTSVCHLLGRLRLRRSGRAQLCETPLRLVEQASDLTSGLECVNQRLESLARRGRVALVGLQRRQIEPPQCATFLADLGVRKEPDESRKQVRGRH